MKPDLRTIKETAACTRVAEQARLQKRQLFRELVLQEQEKEKNGHNENTNRHSKTSNEIYQEAAKRTYVELWKARSFVATDKQRLGLVMESIQKDSTADVLRNAIDGSDDAQLQKLARKVRFDHVGIVVMTPDKFVKLWLKEQHFQTDEKDIFTFNSTIVSKRLGSRYIEPEKQIKTVIKRVNRIMEDPDFPGQETKRQVELFFPEDAAKTEQVSTKSWRKSQALEEIHEEKESHIGLVVRDGHSIVEARVNFLELRLKADGGGTNDKENSTTIYFINPQTGKRLELIKYGEQDEDLVKLHMQGS